MDKKDKSGKEIPEGQKKTAISDEEKKQILAKFKREPFSEEEWIKMLNERYD